MAKDVDEIVVGANGTIWVAPVGTAAPADEDAAPGVGWVDLGYASEDGLTVTDSKTLEVINVWQLFYAARRMVTARDFTVAFALRQWNAATVKLGFGGGAITEPTAGHFKYTPPSPEEVDDRAFLFDWADDTKHYRIVMPRGVTGESVESQLTRSAAADLPISVGVIGSDGVQPWYLLTDDPAFDEA